jgi:hypothetical protein
MISPATEVLGKRSGRSNAGHRMCLPLVFVCKTPAGRKQDPDETNSCPPQPGLAPLADVKIVTRLGFFVGGFERVRDG